MASVTLDNKGLTDGRIKTIGLLLEISKFEARGRIIEVWAHCTEQQVYSLKPAMIDAIAELKGFAQAMVEAELGTVEPDGRIAVRGTKGRIEWLGECRSGSQPGGKARAQNAQRNERGQFVPNDSPPNQQNQHAGESLDQRGPPAEPAPDQQWASTVEPATPAASSPSTTPTSTSSPTTNPNSSAFSCSKRDAPRNLGISPAAGVDNSGERVDGRRIQVTRTRHDEVQFEESLRTALRRAAKEPA